MTTNTDNSPPSILENVVPDEVTIGQTLRTLSNIMHPTQVVIKIPMNLVTYRPFLAVRRNYRAFNMITLGYDYSQPVIANYKTSGICASSFLHALTHQVIQFDKQENIERITGRVPLPIDFVAAHNKCVQGNAQTTFQFTSNTGNAGKLVATVVDNAALMVKSLYFYAVKVGGVDSKESLCFTPLTLELSQYSSIFALQDQGFMTVDMSISRTGSVNVPGNVDNHLPVDLHYYWATVYSAAFRLHQALANIKVADTIAKSMKLGEELSDADQVTLNKLPEVVNFIKLINTINTQYKDSFVVLAPRTDLYCSSETGSIVVSIDQDYSNIKFSNPVMIGNPWERNKQTPGDFQIPFKNIFYPKNSLE